MEVKEYYFTVTPDDHFTFIFFFFTMMFPLYKAQEPIKVVLQSIKHDRKQGNNATIV